MPHATAGCEPPTPPDENLRIEQILRRYREANRPKVEGLPAEIGEILLCVHRHLFGTELNVSFVKRTCGIRNNNVSTDFRRWLGMGIRDYIEDLRLRAATELLRRRAGGICAIGASVGYSHAETFCRAFQRRYGCPPSDFAGRRAELGRRPPRVAGTVAMLARPGC